MENEEVTQLSAEVANLREDQRKILAFTSTQLVEVFAMLDTIIDLQRVALTGQFGVLPEQDAKINQMLAVHRATHELRVQQVQERLVGISADPKAT